MAPRLLLPAVAGTAMVAACIFPSELTVVPEPENAPPVINTEKIGYEPAVQPLDGVIRLDTDAVPRLTISLVEITDADVGDTLYVRWFVGYDPNVRELAVSVADEQIPANGTTFRRASFDLTARLLNDIDTARSNQGQVTTGRPYLVEVMVGDRQPEFGASPRAYPEDAKVARWQWVVERETTGGGG